MTYDEDDEVSCATFRVDEDVLRQMHRLASLVRGLLFRLAPSEIRAAAVVIGTLERLPRQTPGALASVTVRSPRVGANYSWVSISACEDCIELSTGEHAYDPDVGGDTHSSTLFTLGWDGAEGDVIAWRESWARIADANDVGVSASDENEESSIDIDPDE